ncbi:MAG: hypothetical protein AAF334_07415 [Pseudomonadota bacterium]
MDDFRSKILICESFALSVRFKNCIHCITHGRSMTVLSADKPSDTEPTVLALPNTERLVLSATRAWIDAYCSQQLCGPQLKTHLQELGFGNCIGPFYAFHGLLAAAATRELDFRCPKCPSVGDDEQRLLTMFASYQQGQTRVAEIIVQDWMPPAACRRATYAARLVANGLADRGLLLRDLSSRPLVIAQTGPCALH